MNPFYTIIDVSDSEAWTRALDNIPHSFAHTAEHCRSVQLDSESTIILFLFEKDDIKICCPIMERNFNGRKDIAKPFGISGFTGTGSHPAFYDTWMEFVNSCGYLTGYNGIHPLFGKSDWFPRENIYPHHTIQVLDITPQTDTLLENMSKGRRRQFNSWEKVLDSLTVDRSDIQTFFLEHYHDFLGRKKAASYYFFSNKAMESFFQAENSVVVGAVEKGEIVAASYFGYTNHLADGIFTLSLPGKNHYSAQLIWYAILELKSRGVPLLNLGGGKGGIAEFKRRFGAYDVPMLSIKEVYDNSEYACLTGQKDGSLDNYKGFFPAYRTND